MDAKLLTVAEAAAICKCSRSYFYTKILAKGKIRSITLGGRLRRIPVAAVDEFIQRQLREQEGGDGDCANSG